MPIYNRECNDCDEKFDHLSTMAERNSGVCPKCGGRNFVNMIPHVNVISDISHTEGRTGHQGMDMSHVFGEEARDVTSRGQIKEFQKRTRERYIEESGKDRTTFRPICNPGTGKITMEEIVHKGREVDLGEIHEIDGSPPSTHASEKMEKEWQELEKVAEAQVEVPD